MRRLACPPFPPDGAALLAPHRPPPRLLGPPRPGDLACGVTIASWRRCRVRPRPPWGSEQGRLAGAPGEHSEVLPLGAGVVTEPQRGAPGVQQWPWPLQGGGLGAPLPTPARPRLMSGGGREGGAAGGPSELFRSRLLTMEALTRPGRWPLSA